MPYKIQRHNNTLQTLFFVVRTVSYQFSFFLLIYGPCPWAINQQEKTWSVNNSTH